MEENGRNLQPRARTEGLVVRELPDEVLIYDTERHKAFCLNRAAALVWKHCDGRATVADVARSLQKELNGAGDEAVVWYALEQLGRMGLLTERVRAGAGPARLMRRREVVRRLGAAALVLPVVLAIAVPTAQAQGSCVGSNRPPGCPCSNNNQCASNRCVGGTCQPPL